MKVVTIKTCHSNGPFHFLSAPPYGRPPSLEKNSMELPMDGIRFKTHFPWKYPWMAPKKLIFFHGIAYG